MDHTDRSKGIYLPGHSDLCLSASCIPPSNFSKEIFLKEIKTIHVISWIKSVPGRQLDVHRATRGHQHEHLAKENQ